VDSILDGLPAYRQPSPRPSKRSSGSDSISHSTHCCYV